MGGAKAKMSMIAVGKVADIRGSYVKGARL